MSDDILARLKEMAAGGDPAAVKEAPKAPKKVVFVPSPVAPEEATGMPEVPASFKTTPNIPQTAAPVVSTVKTVGTVKTYPQAESAVTQPVVVLDDASTFSNLAGAKVVFIDPTADEVDAAAYAKGISISDLLALRDAFSLILKIVG